MNPIPFLMWYDDKPKTTIDGKIADALRAFKDRLGVDANIVLISTDDDLPVGAKGVDVRVVQTVRRNTVWVGRE